MEPISNSSYIDVGLIRSCSVELQQILALRVQQGLPTSTDYRQIFAEDAMASRSEEQHNAAVNFIFKRIGMVCKTDEILRALN